MSLVAPYETLTSVPLEVVTDVVVAAELAYSRVGRTIKEDPDKIHTLNRCFDISYHIGHSLLKLGKDYQVNALHARYYITRGVEDSIDHCYLFLLTSVFENPIIVDGTWQQFGFYNYDQEVIFKDKPKLLIGTSEEVVKQALAYGFTPEEAATWSYSDNKEIEIHPLALR